MSTIKKKFTAVMTVGMIVAAAMVTGLTSHASAVTISTNNATAMVIRVTPRADRGVEIDTSSVHLNMGSVDLSASTQTVSPATVTIQGSIINTELNLEGLITGGWAFDNNQTLTSTGTNLLNVWATFTSISTVTAPAQNDEYFRVGTSSGAKLIGTDNTFPQTGIGVTGAGGIGRFENNGESGSSDMDGMDPGFARHLWVLFRMPPATSVTSEQEVQFTLSTKTGP